MESGAFTPVISGQARAKKLARVSNTHQQFYQGGTRMRYVEA